MIGHISESRIHELVDSFFFARVGIKAFIGTHKSARREMRSGLIEPLSFDFLFVF